LKLQKNIFLTGFMGSGKTTTAKRLAQAMGCSFYDLDELIEKKEGVTVSEIFNRFGEEHFRKLETSVLSEKLMSEPPSIYSLGGGTICFSDNLTLTKKNGLLVYLELPPKALVQRLRENHDHRPLLKSDKTDLSEKVLTLLKQREPFYKQAHLVVNGINLDIKDLQTKLIALLEKNTL
jgi:shikimate kinase